jgi:hypothetical protein
VVSFFIDTYGDSGAIESIHGPAQQIARGLNSVQWVVPDTGGRPVFRLGLELTSPVRIDGCVTLRELDWSGAPRDLRLGRASELSPDLTPWTTQTVWLKTFVSSAANFAPDYTTTFCISHPDTNGVVTTGSRDWRDYSVSSRITFNQQDGAGLVARSRGHRRYYAALLAAGKALIVSYRDGNQTVLTERAFDYAIDDTYELEFQVHGHELSLLIDGQAWTHAVDATYASGGAGFVVHRGAILADGFRVRQL